MTENDRIAEAARKFVAARRANDSAMSDVPYRRGGIPARTAIRLIRQEYRALEELTRAVERPWKGPLR